jgi:hypothetical protein
MDITQDPRRMSPMSAIRFSTTARLFSSSSIVFAIPHPLMLVE